MPSEILFPEENGVKVRVIFSLWHASKHQMTGQKSGEQREILDLS